MENSVMSAVLSSRDAYFRVKDYIDEDELSPQAKAWYPLIQEWYKVDPSAPGVDRAALRERGKRQFPEKHVDTLVSWFDALPAAASPDNVVKDLLDAKRFTRGNMLCAAIQTGKVDKIAPLHEEYGELLKATDLGGSTFKWTNDDEEMFHRLDRENLIKVAPPSLNTKFRGGASRGDHIVIFGRPEAGKTLFVVNMIAGFLRQNLRVLYVGNEESPYKTRKRVVCNLANATPDQVDAEPDRALAVARERGLDSLWCCHLQPGTLAEVEERVVEVRPDVLVLDQIRNLTVRGRGNDSMVQRLEVLGIGFRAMLGKYDLLGVSVTQARSSEHEGPWLRLDDIDSSRTGLPGTADAIVGIGVDEALVAQGLRAISLSKNKLNPDPDGRAGFTVQVDTMRSKVR